MIRADVPIRWALCLTLFAAHLVFPTPLRGDELRVAVAANFAPVARDLASRFHDQEGVAVRISSGSSGKLYAQILQGGPFDVFLSADADRPTRLVAEGLARDPFTYAVGRLALWLPAAPDSRCRERLLGLEFRRLAMANPRIAPYGLAAEQTLTALQVALPSDRRVIGENIGQVHAFAHTGSVDAALVALSQLRRLESPGGCVWTVPATLHDPVEQQAVALDRAINPDQARAFLRFLRGPGARTMIRDAGYELPD